MSGAFITLEPWLQARFGLPPGHTLALAAIITAIRILGEREGQDRVGSLGATLFGLVYVSFLLHYFTRILTPLPGDTITADGRLLLALWLIATAKFCDVGALLTGLACGRHKMSPVISPKKTWEGAVGGVLVSMGIGALIAWLARDQFPAHFTPLVAALGAIPVALLGIVSDLVESVIKRHAARKDSGNLIPGIGGIFDLSDSLLLVAPVGYLLFRLP
jgi:phosphatidate cytidylyltransferase